MAARAISDTVKLANSVEAPRLGFGVYKSPPDVCVRSCLTALECGYRRIDTAQFYGNESQVGSAVRQSGLAREDLFLATKILRPGGSVEQSYQKCAESVRKLAGDAGYVDQFLIHSPNCGAAQVAEMWQALERLYAEGRARCIGVSNFGIKHIEELRRSAKVWPPLVNQIELHPWLQQRQIVEYCRAQAIVVEAYCPLVRNLKARDETLRYP
ncbi:hypothetical protein CDD83_10618 [Cordyceps sp. RAO-2017]|nr:hypothetical protein CDD83_10618 [Cordyceps sp. RAO-2017]